MIKFLIYLFIFWLLYKFIFDFIIPVYQSTKQVRRQMGDIQERMRQQFEQQQQYQHPEPKRPEPVDKKSDKGDYLDFEEIK
jgi:hypothetical protein